MADYELSPDSDLLLGDDPDAASYARNAERLKKTKRQKYYTSIVSIIGLASIIFLLLHIPPPRHKSPSVPKDPPVTQIKPEFYHDYGSKRVKIKYGPFHVPGNDMKNGMKNFKINDAKPPCHGCLITWIQAGLEFGDGSYANAETGMWLHHTVLINHGRPAIKSCKPKRERFFASGNERTVLDLTLNGTEKSGYWLAESDKVSMTTELMNESKAPQDAFLTMTYEYLSYLPTGFSTVTSIWLDVGNCKGSEVPVPKDTSAFELAMQPWAATVNGRILTVISHIHDGGVHLDILRNGGSVCRSTATYGSSAQHKHHMLDMDMSHISYMSSCYDIGRIGEGEEWTVKAQYDLDAHDPMLDGNGKSDGVMGIAVMYVTEV